MCIFIASFSTTQAVDVISGGIKVNALPEGARAIVNHRIALGSSVTGVKKHIERAIAPNAKELNLTINAFGLRPNARGRFVELAVFGEAIDPAPMTPTSGPFWVCSLGPFDTCCETRSTVDSRLQCRRSTGAIQTLKEPAI